MRTVLATMLAVSLVAGTLSIASAAADKLTPQQEKMKACNADPKAKATKGDERKAFMKECLSKA